MTGEVSKQEAVTFSPNLFAQDPSANFWLKQVTVRLRREICWCWHERGMMPFPDSEGLPPFTDKVSEILDMSRFLEEKRKFYETDLTAHYLTDQLKPAAIPDRNTVRGSFGWVVRKLGLDGVSTFVLALGLAVSFDNAAGSIIASILNDQNKTRPNLALAQKLWDNPEEVMKLADPAHLLFRYGLLRYSGQNMRDSPHIDWEAPFSVPSVVANQLMFPGSHLPAGLAPAGSENNDCCICTANSGPVAARLRNVSGNRPRVVPVRGPRGSARIEIVQGIAGIMKRNVVKLEGDQGLTGNVPYMESIATLCWLKNVDLFIDHNMAPDGKSDGGQFPVRTIPITIFLGIEDKNQLANIPANLLLPIVDVPEFSYKDRIIHWRKVLGNESGGGADKLDGTIAECSRRFRYEKETIDVIGKGLKVNKEFSKDDFTAACRAGLELDMGELAQKVVPRFENEELCLPPAQYRQFLEIIKAMQSLTEVHYGWGTYKAWNEGGISVLFAGPPGTGKTMAAEILAIKLGLPMYRIDLSQVVNKYIGETEKNLKRLFDAADISDIILFFDEADSLFGHRTEVKDAHDRYANLEISYLLERMERFKGLAILATNRKKDIDEAFLRRLRYIIDFPLPDADQRKRIWQQAIPVNVDRSELDLEFLSRQFQLSGGNIRSIVFNACLQSANGSVDGQDGSKGKLTMENVIIAVRREFEKMNRSVNIDQFGQHAAIIRKLEPGND